MLINHVNYKIILVITDMELSSFNYNGRSMLYDDENLK